MVMLWDFLREIYVILEKSHKLVKNPVTWPFKVGSYHLRGCYKTVHLDQGIESLPRYRLG